MHHSHNVQIMLQIGLSNSKAPLRKVQICMPRLSVRNSIQIIRMIINSILENLFWRRWGQQLVRVWIGVSASLTKDFRIFSCCLMIVLTEILEYLVWNPKRFGVPQMLGAPAIWHECPYKNATFNSEHGSMMRDSNGLVRWPCCATSSGWRILINQ